MRMTRMTCVLFVRVFFLQILLHELFITAQVRSVEPSNKSACKLWSWLNARFLNGFIMILKMLYMHVKFEVGSWPASWIAKINQDACVLVWLAFARLNICSKMCRCSSVYDGVTVCCAGQAAQTGFIGAVRESVPAVNTQCNIRLHFLMIFYSWCKISKPIWFAKHYLNSAGYKESHRPAWEIMKNSECEFELESLSSSHYGVNVFKLFSIAGFYQISGFNVLLLCCFWCVLPPVICKVIIIITFIGWTE